MILSVLSLPGVRGSDIPNGYALLLTGSAGSGKTSFSLQFINDGLIRGEKAVLVSFDAPRDELFKAAEGLGFDFADHASDFAVLDYFSERPDNFNDVSISLHKSIEAAHSNARTRIVIDSLSTLALLAGNDSLAPWVMQQRMRLRKISAVGLFCYDPGIHPSTLKLALENVSDGTLELKLEERDDGKLERGFRVFNLRGIGHSSEWLRFEIVPNQGLKFA